MVKIRKDKKCTDTAMETLCLCHIPYKSLLHLTVGLKGPKTLLTYKSECSKLKYINFAANGRFLACIKVRKVEDNQDLLSCCRNLSPITELVLLEARNNCCNGTEDSVKINQAVGPEIDYESSQVDDFNVVASISLDLVEVYYVEMSSDKLQLAVYGFGYNVIPRKPSFSVYEVHLDKNNLISLSQKAKMIFENSGILSAMVTCCKFFPVDANVLVTSICDDYHSVRKTNYLDFWNSKSSLHFARFSLMEKAPKFQGYVTSMSFSSDGLILALTSSTKYCQLLLYSAQTHQFGPVFSQREFTFEDQEDHFPAYSAFATNLEKYELLVCNYHGEMLRLKINPQLLTVAYIISRTMLLNDRLQENFALGFMYCKATSRCIIRSRIGLHFVNTEKNTVEKIMELESREQNNYRDQHSWMAISKTGQEIAVITNNTLQIHLRQNSDFSLMNCCRQKIIHLVPEDKIAQLPLPKTLQFYLLYNYK